MYTQVLTLKPKHADILTGIAQGLTVKEIASKLNTTGSSIQSKLETIRINLDAKNSANAAAIAMSEGLIPGLQTLPQKAPKEKCYISGKITGLPQRQYRANFNKAKAEVERLGLIPVSPVDFTHNHGRTWKEYLREDLIEMLKCSCVYALKNWRASSGATLEINTALAVGLNIIHQ